MKNKHYTHRLTKTGKIKREKSKEKVWKQKMEIQREEIDTE